MTRSSELSTTVQCASFLKSELCDSDVDVGGTCKVRHWKDIYSHSAGRLIACRPPGAPAGHWPHTPWWHCVLHDPYERVNFWSHAVPGVAFLLLGLSALSHLVAGGPPLFIYSCCASITHLFSALTHVYPDSHSLEKLDHIGIVATIAGTPITALMAHEHGHLPPSMICITALLLASSFLRPLPRVLCFIFLGGLIVVIFGGLLLNWKLLAQLILYVSGALFFLSNSGHHRGPGLSDHHLLHYIVTIAGCLHVYYIWEAMKP